MAADTFGGFGKDAIKAMKILHDKMAASDKAFPFSRVVQIFQVAVLRGVVNQLIRRGPLKDVEDIEPTEPPCYRDSHSSSLCQEALGMEASLFNPPSSPPPSSPLFQSPNSLPRPLGSRLLGTPPCNFLSEPSGSPLPLSPSLPLLPS